MTPPRLKYPIGIETFERIRSGGYVYVDKTDYIRQLEENGVYYFMCRPRRFGKSLFISTLEARFEGRRDLFTGLAIDRDDIDWKPRPVFRFTFNSIDPKTDQSLILMIDKQLSGYEDLYQITERRWDVAQRFENLLKIAYEQTNRHCVILIDEYDSPLLSTLTDDKTSLHQSYRNTLRALLTVLKTADRYIHFAFVTGVSRFSHTSLFSGANNISDITLETRYSNIFGITEAEVKRDLHLGILDFAQANNQTPEGAFDSLKSNYDGYHFTANSEDIYNPYSLFRALESNNITDYWFQSGTPTYLVDKLVSENFYLPDLDCIEADPSELSAIESYTGNPIALLYECGYITIHRYDKELDLYTLGIPNREVEQGLMKALMPLYAQRNETDTLKWVKKMRQAIITGNADQLMQLVKTFLAGNPYSNTELQQRERYFKNNLYLIFRLLGFEVRVEEETCHSRSDLVLKTEKYIYILELKKDGTPEQALKQIDAKEYAAPYSEDPRKIIKIGANYSTATNNLDHWLIEQ